MKKNLFMVAAIAFFAAVSCNKEFDQQDNALADNVVSFEATIDEVDTKTTLEGKKTMWLGKEWIQIVGKKSYWFNSENLTESSEQAIFTYNGDNGKYDENEAIVAVYPAGSENYIFEADNKIIKNVELPTSQMAESGTYDPKAALMVAYAEAGDKSLKFKNATALLKFTVTNDNVRSFTFFGHEGEPVSGKLSIAVTENEGPLTITGLKIDENKLYLVPNSNWKTDNARFAAYFYGNGEKWVSMTDSDKDGIYEVAKQNGYSNLIFCRMNPSTTDNNWDNKWNQTGNLTVQEKGQNLYTIPSGDWDSSDNSNWSTNSYVELTAKEDGHLIPEQPYYVAIIPNSFENGFAVELEVDGAKHEVKTYTKSYTINRNTIIDLGSLTYAPDPAVKQERNLAFTKSSVSVVLGSTITNPLSGHTDGVEYSSFAPEVATVDENGNVTIIKEGTTIITAVAPETETHLAGEASYTLTVTKEADNNLYLKPNSNWTQANARFAAYFFNNSTNKNEWVNMVDSDSDGIYEVEKKSGYPNVIFCRMNPSSTTNGWAQDTQKWNQTGDLTSPTDGKNLYTVKAGTWDKGGGTWSVK